MKLVMQRAEYIELIEDVDKLFNKYHVSFKSIKLKILYYCQDFIVNGKKI